MDVKAINENYKKIDGFDYENGIIIDSISKDEVVAHVDGNSKLYNPWNIIHGGLLFGLADTAIGVLCFANGGKGVTIDAHINYLKQCKEYVKAVATPVKIGKTVSVYKADIFNENDELAATLIMNYYNMK